MKMTRVVTLALMLALFALLATSVAAQNSPYLQINNGDSISITQWERPQVVIQFGGGQSGFSNAGILCVALGDLQIRDRAYTHGAFPNFSVAPSPLPLANQAISFPSAFSFLGLADDFRDLNRGQNFNVAFELRLTGRSGGQVLCALVDGAAVAGVAQQLNLGPTNLTDQAVIDLISSVAVSADVLTVNVR